MTNTNLITRTLFGAAAAITTLSMGSIALANDAAPQVAIDVSTVDFGNPTSVDALNLRISRAARQVCARYHGSGVMRSPQEQRCFLETVARSNQQVAALRSANGNGQLAIAMPTKPATR